jgi:uncharacterized protein YceK
MMKRVNGLIFFAVLVIVGGCATAPTETVTAAGKPAGAAAATATVEERAQQRWNLMLAGRLEAAYDMLTATSRQAVTLEEYRAGNKGTYWEGVVVQGKSCDGDVCEVDLEMTYSLREIKGLKRPVKETWVKSGDQWQMIYARRGSKAKQ